MKGSWWREVRVGCAQGGIDVLELFTAMVDDLQDELARAGDRGVQFHLNSVAQQIKSFAFADDVTLPIERDEEIQGVLNTIQQFYLKASSEDFSESLQMRNHCF